MASNIMDRSLVFSSIRRLDKAFTAVDEWVESEMEHEIAQIAQKSFVNNLNVAVSNSPTFSDRDQFVVARDTIFRLPKILAARLLKKDESLFKNQENEISFFSTVSFNECHKEDRIAIEAASKELLGKITKGGQQKTKPAITFLVYARDAIFQAISNRRRTLKGKALEQIQAGKWVDRLKSLPNSILIYQIAPFLQPKIVIPVNIDAHNEYNFVYEDLSHGNNVEGLQRVYLDSYIGSKSRAAARFQALSNLTSAFRPAETIVMLGMLGRRVAYINIPSNISMLYQPTLCPADLDRLIVVLRKTSKYATFIACEKGIEKGSGKHLTHIQWYSDIANPILEGLFKKIQQMKNELAFTRGSADLCEECLRIGKLPGKLVRNSLVPYLQGPAFESLKGASRGFYNALNSVPKSLKVIPQKA
jgi:hypothetical protein